MVAGLTLGTTDDLLQGKCLCGGSWCAKLKCIIVSAASSCSTFVSVSEAAVQIRKGALEVVSAPLLQNTPLNDSFLLRPVEKNEASERSNFCNNAVAEEGEGGGEGGRRNISHVQVGVIKLTVQIRLFSIKEKP
ncbi:hypothetical protein AOLI_G00171770 [Acnodon oligacanthus]